MDGRKDAPKLRRRTELINHGDILLQQLNARYFFKKIKNFVIRLKV